METELGKQASSSDWFVNLDKVAPNDGESRGAIAIASALFDREMRARPFGNRSSGSAKRVQSPIELVFEAKLLSQMGNPVDKLNYHELHFIQRYRLPNFGTGARNGQSPLILESVRDSR